MTNYSHNEHRLGNLHSSLEAEHLQFERKRIERGGTPTPSDPPEDLQQIMGWVCPGQLLPKGKKKCPDITKHR